jgi:hypothetical protein
LLFLMKLSLKLLRKFILLKTESLNIIFSILVKIGSYPHGG